MTSLKLSSDAMNGVDDGASAHADFMSGWTTAEIQGLLEDCYYSATSDPANPSPRNCRHIGNP